MFWNRLHFLRKVIVLHRFSDTFYKNNNGMYYMTLRNWVHLIELNNDEFSIKSNDVITDDMT